MSRSLSLVVVTRPPRAAGRIPRLERGSGATPWRVREWSPADPVVPHVLDGTRELRFVSAESLPAVVRALEEAGHVVVVRYDAEEQRLAYYTRPARAPLAEDLARRPGQRPRQGDVGSVAGGDAAASERPLDRVDPAARPPAEGHRYEGEGSQRLSVGSVSVASDAWWSAVLSVPEIDAGTLFLQLQRHGALPSSYRGDAGAELSLPASEVDAVVTLLAGVLAQARRDGVLPARVS